jgi:hypothetical protein
MSVSQRSYASKLAPVKDVLKTARYRWIILAVGLAYAIVYMLVLGIISYYPDWNPTKYPTVSFYGYTAITAVPANHVFVFIFYPALAFIVISSFFVGLNVALMLYSRKMSRVCGVKIKNVGSRGMFGLLPAFFTSFACCGGGLMTMVLGATAFGTLALYSQYMTPISIAALAGGTYLASSRISRSCR